MGSDDDDVVVEVGADVVVVDDVLVVVELVVELDVAVLAGAVVVVDAAGSCVPVVAGADDDPGSGAEAPCDRHTGRTGRTGHGMIGQPGHRGGGRPGRRRRGTRAGAARRGERADAARRVRRHRMDVETGARAQGTRDAEAGQHRRAGSEHNQGGTTTFERLGVAVGVGDVAGTRRAGLRRRKVTRFHRRHPLAGQGCGAVVP